MQSFSYEHETVATSGAAVGVTESRSDEAVFPTDTDDDQPYYSYSYGYDDVLDGGGDEHVDEPEETSFERKLYDEQFMGLLLQSMCLPIG